LEGVCNPLLFVLTLIVLQRCHSWPKYFCLQLISQEVLQAFYFPQVQINICLDNASKCSSPLGELNSPKEQVIHQENGSENILHTLNNKSPKRNRRHHITRNKYFLYIYQ
jgi:hypothetical protein